MSGAPNLHFSDAVVNVIHVFNAQIWVHMLMLTILNKTKIICFFYFFLLCFFLQSFVSDGCV